MRYRKNLKKLCIAVCTTAIGITGCGRQEYTINTGNSQNVNEQAPISEGQRIANEFWNKIGTAIDETKEDLAEYKEYKNGNTTSTDEDMNAEIEQETDTPDDKEFHISSPYDDGFLDAVIPEESQHAYVTINNNTPYFLEYTTEPFEYYSDLDALGRCGYAFANICEEIMPTEERGEIGSVKPSGWKNEKYDFIDGKYLYNRCHLIGYQLSGENANEQNLITGTRYLNIQGMLSFENMIAEYVETTKNHVLYRVTPVFEEDNLLAEGVLMEALSVEDSGAGIKFCVFAYNVQPGVVIDYSTGDNWLNESNDAERPSKEDQSRYILNTNTKRIHIPDCSAVDDISENNRMDYIGALNILECEGYTPCGICIDN